MKPNLYHSGTANGKPHPGGCFGPIAYGRWDTHPGEAFCQTIRKESRLHYSLYVKNEDLTPMFFLFFPYSGRVFTSSTGIYILSGAWVGNLQRDMICPILWPFCNRPCRGRGFCCRRATTRSIDLRKRGVSVSNWWTLPELRPFFEVICWCSCLFSPEPWFLRIWFLRWSNFRV